jgi:hypothetical protein
MSIINFQTSVMADHETHSQTQTGQNVTDREAEVTDTSINIYADDGEKIFNTDFSTKKNLQPLQLHSCFNRNHIRHLRFKRRTAKIAGYAGKGGLFVYHIGLMSFPPAAVVHMYPVLFAKAASTIANKSRANYFYIIAYPEYSGHRVEHDPTFTAYIATAPSTTQEQPPTGAPGIIIIAIIIIAVGIGIAVFIARRKIS